MLSSYEFSRRLPGMFSLFTHVAILALLLSLNTSLMASVTVAPASVSGINVQGGVSCYTSLGSISLTEIVNKDDIPQTGGTLILNCPAGFQFNTTGIFGSVTTSMDITGFSFASATSSAITFNVTGNGGGTTLGDVLSITGVLVQATSTSASGNITFSGTCVLVGANPISLTAVSYAGCPVITTIAGSTASPPVSGYTGDNGPASSALLFGPWGVALDGSGNNLYIADTYNHAIRKISGGTITTIAGNGTGGFAGDNGPASASQVRQPEAITLDAAGNIYISDTWNHCIRKISTGGTITTIAGTGGTFGSSGDNGPATAALLNQPSGITLDAAGNIYFADYGNNRVRKINTSGTITTIAGTTMGYSGDAGAATLAQLHFPFGVAVDAAGNVYIGDQGNNCVRRVNTSGIISTIAGNGTAGFAGDGGPAGASQLNYTCGLFLDASGNLFIADNGNHRIREINATTGNINTVGGNGNPGWTGDGGNSLQGRLYWPITMVVDASCNVYIADYNNNRIREITGLSVMPSAGCAVLPVNLVSFTGSFGYDNFAHLSWSVASEQNNDYFAVERSSDGDSYAEIGIVKGAGNSSTAKNYEFTDYAAGILSPTIYYRLRQVDYDGHFTYPGTVALHRPAAQQDLLIGPNPVKDALFIRIPESTAGCGFTVSDLLGKEVMSIAIPAGSNEFRADTRTLQPGVYFLKSAAARAKFVKE